MSVTRYSACSRWVCSASAVTTQPARSSGSSSGANRVISLVLPSTAVWARTALACWSMAASRCAACPSPRAVPGAAQRLAVYRHRAAPGRVLSWAACLASQDVTAESSSSASTASRTRRMVASPAAGTGPPAGRSGCPARPARAAGRRRPIRRSRPATARPPARPPARSAAPMSASGGCRGDHAGQAPSSGIPAGQRTRRRQPLPDVPASCNRAGLIRDDGSAGTVFRHDHGIRHPHDLGNRACSTPTTTEPPTGHQPVITPLCRGPDPAWLIAASSRLQQIRCTSSRCRVEGTREYARVDSRSIIFPSWHVTVTQ